jgi:SAM-dependent methyltransferase
MKVESSVVSHFTASVDRYTDPPSPPDDFAMRAFGPLAGTHARVLELGCGTGHRLAGLDRDHAAFRLFGLDITPIMVQKARQIRPAAISFMVGDCLHVPFESGQFDAIIIYNVLHHLVTGNKSASDLLRQRGLNELVRLLAPGGRIVLEEYCVNTAWRARLVFLFSHLVSRLHLSVPRLHIHTDVVTNFFTLAELDHAIAKSGLHIVHREVDRFPGFAVRLSTFGDTTYQVRCVLERTG